MQELDKILEEIDIKIAGSMGRKREGLLEARDIIRKHMNDRPCSECSRRKFYQAGYRDGKTDGWIPVEERLPEVNADIEEIIEDDDCPEYNVTIQGASESTTLKYSPDGTWFDDNGHIYAVIAWRPLPDPYKPEGAYDYK